MKNYFLKLLQYDKQSNLQMLDAMFEARQPQKAVQLMAHLLAAQQVWLLRCKALPASGGPLWPDWEAIQFKYMIEENADSWINYISTLQEDDFEKTISYQNFRGEPCNDKLVDIMAHLINHGTHHRAQIGQQLKQAGLEQLPLTDYIFYARTQKQ